MRNHTVLVLHIPASHHILVMVEISSNPAALPRGGSLFKDLRNQDTTGLLRFGGQKHGFWGNMGAE
ncbi:MAG: hypothetical protein ABSB35_07365 [Bryobacteraceae bacterium]|jgi:hypothetical protein